MRKLTIKNEIVKKNKGITLVVLVITIIILLILAGLTISTMSRSGLLEKTEIAKEENNKETASEIITIKIEDIQINSYAENKKEATLQYIANKLAEDEDIEYVKTKSKKIASNNKIEIGEETSIYTKLVEYPYEFEINSNLQIASIDGEKISSKDAYEDGYNAGKKDAKIERKVIESLRYAGGNTGYNTTLADGRRVTHGTLTYDISKILPEHYQNLTRDNFVADVSLAYVYYDNNSLTTTSDPIVIGIISYENGILTVDFPEHIRDGRTFSLDISIIAYYIK